MLSKRLINSNDAAAGGACTTNTNDYPTTNVAYYKMSTAADEKDTYNGAATDVNFNVQGKFGNAAEFNGSSSVISLGTSSPLNTFGGAQTISIWVKPSSASQEAIIGYRGDGGDYWWNLIEKMNNNRIRFLLGSTGNGQFVFNSVGTITLNQWNHIAITVDSTSAKIYINNGTAETLAGTPTSFSNSEPTSIGGDGTTDTDYFTGQIDQVRIFDSALDATQVASLYNEVYCVPTIVPTDYFNTVLYTGNNTATPISTGFAPDLVWIKNRTGTPDHHSLIDSVRGKNSQIFSNLSNAQNTFTDQLDSFNSNGFTVGTGFIGTEAGRITNVSGEDYVAWNWEAGGAAVSNTDGTITTQVSANVDAGFSIVSYTGNGTLGATFGHGLDSAPELIIQKNLDEAQSWIVNADAIGKSNVLTLNSTGAILSRPNQYYYAWDSSTITTGSNIHTNGLNDEIVVYAFHSVDGFSKIGSYKGTGVDVPVNLGFRPAFVMIKCVDNNGSSWFIVDNKRGAGAKGVAKFLRPDTSGAEFTNSVYGCVFNSSGFTIPSLTSVNLNQNGIEYIFMAFAEEVLPYVTRNATDPFGDSSELALYKFEDDANDAEGSYNGTATASVTYPTGYIDKGLSGFTSSQYVSIPTMGVFLAKNTSSVSMWIKSSGATSPFDFIFTDYAQQNFNHTIMLYADGSIRRQSRYNNVYSTEISSGTGFGDNNWHHVVSIVNTSDNTQQLYVDGNLAASGSIPTDSWSSSITNRKVLIGGLWGNNSTNDLPFGGSVDQVRIFNRALDDGEVTALYNE